MLNVTKVNINDLHNRNRVRREYRGRSKQRPVFNVFSVHSWRQSFERARATPAMRHVCDAMLERYEARVREWGYSLLDLEFRGPSPLDRFALVTRPGL